MKYLITLTLLIAFTYPTYAQCYSRAEAEADQGLRIQSELMVIGLNCQSMGARHGMAPYQNYRAFSETNAELFQIYEQILQKFYTKNQINAEQSLNDLRTHYANDISKVAAAQRPDVFCARHIDRITKAMEMNETQLRGWASTLYPSHPVQYPLCKG